MKKHLWPDILPSCFSVRLSGLACLLTVICLTFAASAFAEGVEVGQALTIVPGVFVERDGERMPLAQNDMVLDTDTITTDSAGRARIIFQDDGAVTLGPNTSLALIEVLPEGDAPAFKAHVGQGLVRFITGKIVEANPDGFAVTTPEGTVGIRGTIFVLQTGNGHTTLYVVNASRPVVLNDVLVPGGFKMTLPGGSPVPMTPEDVAVTQTVAVVSEESLPPALEPGGIADSADLADLGLSTQAMGDELSPQTTPPSPTPPPSPPPLPPPPPPQLTGRIEGTLDNLSHDFVSSVFAFDVDLSSGAISNASSSGTFGTAGVGWGGITWSYSGGSGSFAAGTFTVGGFSGTVSQVDSAEVLMPNSITIAAPAGADMTGSGGYANVGDSVTGLHVIAPAGSGLQGAGPAAFPVQAEMTGQRVQ